MLSSTSISFNNSNNSMKLLLVHPFVAFIVGLSNISPSQKSILYNNSLYRRRTNGHVFFSNPDVFDSDNKYRTIICLIDRFSILVSKLQKLINSLFILFNVTCIRLTLLYIICVTNFIIINHAIWNSHFSNWRWGLHIWKNILHNFILVFIQKIYFVKFDKISVAFHLGLYTWNESGHKSSMHTKNNKLNQFFFQI